MEADFVIEDGVLTKYCGSGGHVVIPEGVGTIGHSVFDRCAGLTGVTLPESLVNIEFHAFMECENLSEITIPKNVRRIGPWAFFDCKSLEKITILGGQTAPAGKSEEPFERVDAPITAPNLSLRDMSSFWKPRAAWGFALERERFPQARQDEYLKYVKSQRKRLCPLAVRHQNLLLMMLEEGLIPEKDVPLFLEEADRQRSTAAKSSILAYQP